MAADNNTNSSSGEKTSAPVVKTGGDNGPKRGSLPSMNKKNVLRGLLIIVILVIGAGLIAGRLHIGSKVYAEVDGHKFYKKDIQNIKLNDKSVSNHNAAIVLADKYLSQAMAQEQNVTVSQADITAAGCSNQKSKPFGYQNCVNGVYFANLANDNVGVYQGKYIMASFGRYVPYQSSLLAEQKEEDPKLGNPAAIAADKAYAQTFITNLYNQIKAGKISFDQAIQIEHGDPVIGQGSAYRNQPHSGDFDGPLNQYNAFSAPSLKQKIASIKPGETTKPFVVRVSDSAADPSNTAESYFLVVRMDKASGGNSSGLDFSQALQQAKKKLGYKINV